VLWFVGVEDVFRSLAGILRGPPKMFVMSVVMNMVMSEARESTSTL
jgi:hypothetical protein